MLECVSDKIKGQIEHHRMSLVMQGLVDADNQQPDQTETELRRHLETEKDK